MEKAVDAASKAFQSWKRASVDTRAGLLVKAAALMRERKHEFSATMVYEVGKTWPEADADTAEAIDFMEFYAREAVRYGGEQPITKISSFRRSLNVTRLPRPLRRLPPACGGYFADQQDLDWPDWNHLSR